MKKAQHNIPVVFTVNFLKNYNIFLALAQFFAMFIYSFEAWQHRQKDFSQRFSVFIGFYHHKFIIITSHALLHKDKILKVVNSLSQNVKNTFQEDIYFGSNMCSHYFSDFFSKKGPGPKCTIHKHESGKNKEFLSVGNFGIPYVVVVCSVRSAYFSLCIEACLKCLKIPLTILFHLNEKYGQNYKAEFFIRPKI